MVCRWRLYKPPAGFIRCLPVFSALLQILKALFQGRVVFCDHHYLIHASNSLIRTLWCFKSSLIRLKGWARLLPKHYTQPLEFRFRFPPSEASKFQETHIFFTLYYKDRYVFHMFCSRAWSEPFDTFNLFSFMWLVCQTIQCHSSALNSSKRCLLSSRNVQ